MGLGQIHIAFNNPPAAIAFYTTVLAPLGYTILYTFKDRMAMGVNNKADFWMREYRRGPDAEDPQEVKVLPFAFSADNRKQVDEVCAAAMRMGGKDNGAPAFRADYGPGHYTASIIDPEGNTFDVVAD